MPFVAHGKAPSFEAKAFCCLMINGKFKRSANEIPLTAEDPVRGEMGEATSQWKLHHFENGQWKRIATGLPDDATECAPTAEFIDDKWKLSFIAGGYESDRKFYLYKIDDLENPIAEKILQAEVGYIFKGRTVHARRSGDIIIADDMQIKIMHLSDVEYLYRLSYNPNNPNEILISGQDYDGKLFSWICDLKMQTLFAIFDSDIPAYKAALFNGVCYYAKRNNSDDFEDRRIVEANNFSKVQLDFDSHIKIEIKDNIPTNFDMAKNFANATLRFVKAGFKLADDETLKRRNILCTSCEFWKANARLGLGKCMKCGCSSAKLYLASESCPIKKW